MSVPEDKVLREDFGRRVVADYSTPELECAAGVFPLSRALEGASILGWALQYFKTSEDRQQRWQRFQDEVLTKIQTYMVPVIKLTKETPKEAVSTVFEKVNTGGVPLNVFELVTATFAGEQWHYEEHGDDFRLADDWKRIQENLKQHRVLQGFENTDFLQAVTLVATFERRGGTSAVSCKRRDILRLSLREYLAIAPRIEKSLHWVAAFLNQQRVFRSADLPYRTQIVPLEWCVENGVDMDRRESIVNKTALSSRTNRMIGGRSPKEYLEKVDREAGLPSEQVDTLLRTHHIDPGALRAADFETFFANRSRSLLELVDRAMGKPATRTVQEPDADRPDSFEPDEPEAADSDL
ncbi:hypothetical protein [Amycolatopsis thermoflava]|uniref:hypothetical protein n=1 Tax=Amycolatopsis thermoflava TaxID=84480 RepID=UPI003F4A21AF